MPKATNAWAAQTRWLTDKTYYSETPGIWTDRISRRDRASGVTDSELKRHHGGRGALADAFGNLPPRNRSDAARVIVERIMARLSPSQRAAITPRQKWDIVAALADSAR